MINETLKNLNIESKSNKFKNTTRIKNDWLSNTFDERIAKICRFLESAHLKNSSGFGYPPKITGDIIRKKLSSPPSPTPDELLDVGAKYQVEDCLSHF